MKVALTQIITKKVSGEKTRDFMTVNREKNEIRFGINEKKIILTMEEYEILKELDKNMF
ncbi:hypothetical protein ACNFU2_06425 [Chryseobacterium sp. PTM-20240506]|uniref:hypothetical protein n=1 Tax=Chryseobacterium sp. PTM-20240506 TaxID=3400631 RepID=UPI003AAA7229